MQQSLLSMINALGAGYQFMGIAEPETDPGSPDQKVFYLAGVGDYPHFGNIHIEKGIGVLTWDDSWELQTIELDDIYDKLEEILGTYQSEQKDVSGWQNGYYNNYGIVEQNAAFRYSPKYNVAPGDSYLLHGSSSPATYISVISFFKDNVFVSNIIGKDERFGVFSDYAGTIPQGVNQVAFSSYQGQDIALTLTQKVDGKIDDIYRKIDGVPVMKSFILGGNVQTEVDQVGIGSDWEHGSYGLQYPIDGAYIPSPYYRSKVFTVNPGDTYDFFGYIPNAASYYYPVAFFKDGIFVDKILATINEIEEFTGIIPDGVNQVAFSTYYNNPATDSYKLELIRTYTPLEPRVAEVERDIRHIGDKGYAAMQIASLVFPPTFYSASC